MQYCTRCLNPVTRPRITFNESGLCNACVHHDLKQNTDWKKRKRDLKKILKTYRKKGFDVIVPCSGGKDGSYVAWRLKNDYKMHPLCVTLVPQMPTEIGRVNLQNFINTGFDHITINPNPKEYRRLAKIGFIEEGQPKMPFVDGISTAIFQLAQSLDIPLIMYGEEGEKEYGGADDAETKITKKYLIDYYYSGKDPSKYGTWWKLLSNKDIKKLYPTHWSKFEDWDPELHARFCSEKTGLQMSVGGQIGTLTNYAQLDDKLQDLHAFLMFCKFGFGRATSDACIEIRRGRMTREDGITFIKKLDGQFPVEYEQEYLDYFEMTKEEFWATIEKFVNWEILEKTGLPEKPYKVKDDVYNLLSPQGSTTEQGVVTDTPQV
jgi:N-acetyl sugar amidotransferase